MHIQRKPGDQIEVDWAGDTASVIDRDTGEIIPAYIFVGVLSYSLYAYVEAFFSQDMDSLDYSTCQHVQVLWRVDTNARSR